MEHRVVSVGRRGEEQKDREEGERTKGHLIHCVIFSYKDAQRHGWCGLGWLKTERILLSQSNSAGIDINVVHRTVL